MDMDVLEDPLVVDIGDPMLDWSNERFRSAEHYVILKPFID
ncbi:hypothetical protein SLEP1_g22404 [Rubroshorea leprosula]|uniref:Uncharacterized protein n=1 Tax=Rubroshorea leprosula TaxID=152421 RepID=A0AAV5J932_9ROSI|nr:hypothetical protein SLEP1_g22404 [Rubroshorea leprosula]